MPAFFEIGEPPVDKLPRRRNRAISSRFVLGDFIDTMESIVEIDMCEPGRKGPIPVRVCLSKGC